MKDLLAFSGFRNSLVPSQLELAQPVVAPVMGKLCRPIRQRGVRVELGCCPWGAQQFVLASIGDGTAT